MIDSPEHHVLEDSLGKASVSLSSLDKVPTKTVNRAAYATNLYGAAFDLPALQAQVDETDAWRSARETTITGPATATVRPVDVTATILDILNLMETQGLYFTRVGTKLSSEVSKCATSPYKLSMKLLASWPTQLLASTVAGIANEVRRILQCAEYIPSSELNNIIAACMRQKAIGHQQAAAGAGADQLQPLLGSHLDQTACVIADADPLLEARSDTAEFLLDSGGGSPGRASVGSKRSRTGSAAAASAAATAETAEESAPKRRRREPAVRLLQAWRREDRHWHHRLHSAGAAVNPRALPPMGPDPRLVAQLATRAMALADVLLGLDAARPEQAVRRVMDAMETIGMEGSGQGPGVSRVCASSTTAGTGEKQLPASSSSASSATSTGRNTAHVQSTGSGPGYDPELGSLIAAAMEQDGQQQAQSMEEDGPHQAQSMQEDGPHQVQTVAKADHNQQHERTMKQREPSEVDPIEPVLAVPVSSASLSVTGIASGPPQAGAEGSTIAPGCSSANNAVAPSALNTHPLPSLSISGSAQFHQVRQSLGAPARVWPHEQVAPVRQLSEWLWTSESGVLLLHEFAGATCCQLRVGAQVAVRRATRKGASGPVSVDEWVGLAALEWLRWFVAISAGLRGVGSIGKLPSAFVVARAVLGVGSHGAGSRSGKGGRGATVAAQSGASGPEHEGRPGSRQGFIEKDGD